MMTDRELMQQALEALELHAKQYPHMQKGYTVDAIAALRERLAQSEHEPVAWMNPSWIDPDTRGWASDSFESIQIGGWIPLYTAPRQWQGLPGQEIKDCEKQAMVNGALPFEQRFFFARAIEAKLKEKNNG